MITCKPLPGLILEDVNEFTPKKVITRDHTTICIWEDGTKTVATCAKDAAFDPYVGVMACFMKRIYGGTVFHKKMENALKKLIVQVPPKPPESPKPPKKSATKKKTSK